MVIDAHEAALISEQLARLSLILIMSIYFYRSNPDADRVHSIQRVHQYADVGDIESRRSNHIH